MKSRKLQNFKSFSDELLKKSKDFSLINKMSAKSKDSLKKLLENQLKKEQQQVKVVKVSKLKKLKKQEEKVFKPKKSKKKTAYVPNVKSLEKGSKEEDMFRELLEMYLDDKFSNQNPIVKKTFARFTKLEKLGKKSSEEISEKWEAMDKDAKLREILNANSQFYFPLAQFYRLFLQLPKDNLEEIIEQYLKSNDKLFDVIRPLLNIPSEEDIEITKESKKSSEENRDEYLQMAAILGVSSAEKRNPADLTISVTENLKNLKQKIDPTLVEQVENMTHKELNKLAKHELGRKFKKMPISVLRVKLYKSFAYPSYFKDVKDLVEKLVDFTGESAEKYKNKTYNELLLRYKELIEPEFDLNFDEPIEQEEKILSFSRLEDCIEFYKNFEWIRGNVKSVWIVPLDKNDLNTYASPSTIKIEKRPKKWFKGNEEFFKLLCSDNSRKNFQEGEIFVCYDDEDNEVRFYVGYLVSELYSEYKSHSYVVKSGEHKDLNLVVQNSKIYASQIEFQTKEIELREKKITEVLRKPVNHISEITARVLLCRELLKIAQKVDYGSLDCNTTYINAAIKSVKRDSQKNREYFMAIAVPIVFMNLNQAEIFRARIREEYYLPEVLLRLSDVEMLPEIYNNPLISPESSTVNNMVYYVKIMSERLMHNLVQIYLTIANPTAQRRKYKIEQMLKEPDIIVDCVNRSELSKVDPVNLEYYIDPDTTEIYCLDVEKIVENKFKNPHTNKPLDKAFLNRYVISYTDSEGETYFFPYKKLMKKFLKSDFVNQHTGKLFSKSFINDVLEGKQKAEFRKINHMLERCSNYEHVKNEPVWNIVFYEDQGIPYCLKIDQVRKILTGPKPVNPYTEKKFSSDFVENFKKTYKIPEKKSKDFEGKCAEKDEIKGELVANLWMEIVKSVKSYKNEEDDQEDDEDDEDLNLSMVVTDDDQEEPEFSIGVKSSDILTHSETLNELLSSEIDEKNDTKNDTKNNTKNDTKNDVTYSPTNTVIIDDYDEVCKTQPKNCVMASPYEFTEKEGGDDSFLKKAFELIEEKFRAL